MIEAEKTVRSENSIRSQLFTLFAAIAMLTACSPTTPTYCAESREFLYIEDPDGALSSYKIEPDGELTLTATLAGASEPERYTGPPTLALAVQPGGRFAISWDQTRGDMKCYSVDPNDGRLATNPAACAPPAVAGGGLTTSAAGRLSYVGPHPYAIDRASGKVVAVDSKLGFSGAWDLVLARSRKFAYLMYDKANFITSYRIHAGGAMRLVSGMKGVPTEVSPSDFVLDPGGYFAYAVSRADIISAYFIDPHNGALRVNPKTPTIRTRSGAISAVIDGSGRFLYCTNSDDETISQYRIESDGSLSFAGATSAPGVGEESMVTDPAGKFIYIQVGTPEKASLIGFRIADDGQLIRINLAPIPIIGADSPYFLPTPAWIGSAPAVKVVQRDVTPLTRMKTSIAGTFTETGLMAPIPPMYIWRSEGTLLPDGRVFIPEELQSGLGTLKAEIYDPRRGKFTSSGIIAKGGGIITRLLDGRFLIGLWPDKLNILDPTTMKMSPAGHLKAQCYRPHWLLKDGRILFPAIIESPYFEGMADRSCAGEIYDPATGQSVDPPGVLSGFEIVTVLADGRLLLLKTNQDRPRRGKPPQPRQPPQAYTYDLATDRMVSLGVFPDHDPPNRPIVLKDGTVLFVNTDHPDDGTTAELFDPLTSKFISFGPLAQPHGVGFDLTLLTDGRVLISGGAGRTNSELFDPRTRKFTPTGTMTTLRKYPTIVVLDDGTVLFAGGDGEGLNVVNARLPYDTAEIYHPPPRE